ncbi:HdeD family acid-resistance protein [Aldersonia kunmingensis]|uniref:HdeD family acid-resistance protein n=1 Tax=Aldersonia kunmingensis TaxID=408066 RepID=UPI0008327D91|nr:HdeD family acid-resistance protein [Aldersonia kunmingensis]
MTTRVEVIEFNRNIWWIMVVRGLIGIIFGFIALIWPEITLWAIVWVFGIYAIIDGIIALVHVLRGEKAEHWVWSLLLGLVAVGAGIVCIVWPDITVLVLVYIVAFYAILFGVIGLASAISRRKTPGPAWFLQIAASVLAIIFGIILLVHPDFSVKIFVYLLGGWAIFFGILLTAAGFQLKTELNRAEDTTV